VQRGSRKPEEKVLATTQSKSAPAMPTTMNQLRPLSRLRVNNSYGGFPIIGG
jgi:hypothetical protein